MFSDRSISSSFYFSYTWEDECLSSLIEFYDLSSLEGSTERLKKVVLFWDDLIRVLEPIELRLMPINLSNHFSLNIFDMSTPFYFACTKMFSSHSENLFTLDASIKSLWWSLTVFINYFPALTSFSSAVTATICFGYTLHKFN